MKKLALLDYCLPDYFTGYHLPVLAVPVFHSLTNAQMAEELQNEFDSCFDLFEGIKDFENCLNSFCEELLKNPEQVFIEQAEIGEDDECAYAYFSLIEPKVVNSITFLS